MGRNFKKFYKEIQEGLKGFSIWEKQINISNRNSLFKFYIQMISDIIRKLNLLMITRSKCKII